MANSDQIEKITAKNASGRGGASGRSGEEKACFYLQGAGMEILEKNYRCKKRIPGTGEIDIIAKDGDIIVFIEVKTWAFYSMEDLQYSIDAKKQAKIIKTAKYFLSENRQYSKMAIRFDIVFVKDTNQGVEITHLASAFTESV